MRTTAFGLALPLSLAACVTAPRPPACADTVFPLNKRIANWSVGKFVGDYRRGGAIVTVRLQDYRLLITRPGGTAREVRGATLDSWTMLDGCGVRYEFQLPPDGPGAWLGITDASGKTEWTRS